MDTVDSADILAQGVRRVLGEERAGSARGTRSSSAGSFEASRGSTAAVAGPGSSGPRIAILKAEQLLQIVATAQPTPISRQIAAAAYLMEAQAQQELARIRRLSVEAGREWFA